MPNPYAEDYTQPPNMGFLMNRMLGPRGPKPEDLYPALGDMIKALRAKHPGLDDVDLTNILARAETRFKGSLPVGVSPAQVDVEMFGRVPNFITRIMGEAATRTGVQFLWPQVEKILGLPKGSMMNVVERGRHYGGVAPFLGAVVGDLPLVQMTGGLSHGLGLARPWLTEAVSGAAFGTLSPLLEGKDPTLGRTATDAALFPLIGGVLRKLGASSAARDLRARAEASTKLGQATEQPLLGVRPPGMEPPSPNLGAPGGGGQMDLFGRQEPPFMSGAAGVPPPGPRPPIPGVEPPPNPLANPPFGPPGATVGRGKGAFYSPSTEFEPPPIPREPGAQLGAAQLGPRPPEIGTLPAPVADMAEAAGIVPRNVDLARRSGQAPFTAAEAEAEVSRQAAMQGRAGELGKIAQVPITQAGQRAGRAFGLKEEDLPGVVSLHMGFNPFEAARGVGRLWKDLTAPHSEYQSRLLKDLPGQLLNAVVPQLRLPLNLFRKGGGEAGERFANIVEDYLTSFQILDAKYHGALDTATKGVRRSPARTIETIMALNDRAAYELATPEARAAADGIRTGVYDPLHEVSAQTARDLGKAPPGYTADYFTHSLDRTATWRLLERERVAAERAGNLDSAQAWATMQAEFADRGSTKLLATDEFRALTGRSLRDLFRDVPMGETPFGPLKERLANLPTWRQDLSIVEAYIRGSVRKNLLDPQLETLAGLITEMPRALQPRAVVYLRDLMGIRHPSASAFEGFATKVGMGLDKLTRGAVDPFAFKERMNWEWMSRTARQAEYMRTLYGNVGGALVNATQPITTVWPYLAQEMGPVKAGEYMMRGFNLMLQPEGRALAREMGAYRGLGPLAAEGRPHSMEGMLGWGDVFGIVEQGFNRPLAGISQYLAKVDAGANHEQALRAAVKFMRETQFQLGPEMVPQAFRGPGGRMAYQFQGFKQQYLNFFLNTLDWRGKMYFGLTMLALGGPSAMPIMGPWLTQLARQADMEYAATGVPGAMGVDLAQRLSPVDPLRFAGEKDILPQLVRSLTGPTVGLGIGLVQSLARLHDLGGGLGSMGLAPSTWVRSAAEPLMRELEPVALQRLAAASEVGQTGQVRAGQPSGIGFAMRAVGVQPPGFLPERYGGFKALYGAEKGQMSAALMAGVGLPAMERSRLEDVASTEKTARAVHAAQRDRVIEGYLRFKTTGDAEDMIRAVRSAPGIDVRGIIRDVEEPLTKRLTELTPKRFRPTLMQQLMQMQPQ